MGKSVDNPLRIGIFGGTFDPLHNVHLRIAEAACAAAALDRVLFVVSATPPHKRDDVTASAEDRCAMTAAAIANRPGFEICRCELDRPGPSYTADTVEWVQEAYPGAIIYLIIGYDSAVDLPRWRHPERILNRAHLLIAPRPDCPRTLGPELNGRYDLLSFAADTLSSTEIRERLEAGEDISDWAPAAVVHYIREKGLYSCR